MVFKTICVGSIPAIFVIISTIPTYQYPKTKKVLTKTNKFKFLTNTYKLNYLKLRKKIKLSFYKINKFTKNISKIKIDLNHQSNLKKQHSLPLLRFKWNKFWFNRQNNVIRKNRLMQKSPCSTFFAKNYLFLKKSKIVYFSFLNNLLFNTKYVSTFYKTQNNNLLPYTMSLNINKSLFAKINQKFSIKNKIFNISNLDLQPMITPTKTSKHVINLIPTTSSSKILPKFWPLFLHFVYEQKFIYNKSRHQKSSFVLSKIPFYKMDSVSPVTADKNRGNIYTKLSLINFKKLNKNTITNNLALINYNSKFLSLISPIQSNSLNLTKLNWTNQLNQWKQNQKYYKVFENNNLNYKLQQNFTFLKTIVIYKIKNKIPSSHLFLNLIPKFKQRKKYKKFKPFENKRLIRKQNFFKKKLKFDSKRNNINKPKTFLLKKINFKNHKSKIKAYKNNIIFSASFLNWKLNKRINMFNSFNRLSIKRKHYVTNLTNFNNHTFVSHNLHNLNLLNSRSNINKIWFSKKNKIQTQNDFNLIKLNNHYLTFTNSNLLLNLLTNKLLYKINYCTKQNLNKICLTSLINLKFNEIKQINTNLVPNTTFKKSIKKKVLNSFSNKNFNENVIPWYLNTFVRFIEHCSGKKTLFQFYPFLAKSVLPEDTIRYKRWLPRMVFYERKLGHRFFMEEALYLIHLSFTLKDPKIFSSWLKAIILRISFWKTRSIFRFIKYLFHNYFRYVFNELNVKGMKIKLKGKISAAGNSRKRTILYRIGKTSHSRTNLRVLYESTTVNTFTGVMGLGVWIFY